MNKFKDIAEFENLLKDTMQTHSTPAPPDVWSSVTASTAQSAGVLSQAASFLSSTTNLLKVALFASGISAVGLVIYNENQVPQKTITENTIAQPSEAKSDTTIDIQTENKTKEDNETTTRKITGDPITTDDSKHLKSKNKNDTKKTTNTPRVNTSTPSVQNDGTTSPKIGEETRQDNSKNEIAATLQISSTNYKPCLGDVVVLSANEAVIWYANNTPLNKTATQKLSYTCTVLGKVIISGGNKSIILKVGDPASKISLTKSNSGEYTVTLVNATQLANWYLDGELIATNENKTTQQITEVGTHTLKAVIVNQYCAKSASETVTVSPVGEIKIWDIFTPNGDGKNDTYTVDIKGYLNYSMQIIDSKNKLLFFSTDPENGWNGREENIGNECSSGNYVAIISYTLKGEEPVTKNVRFKLQRS